MQGKNSSYYLNSLLKTPYIYNEIIFMSEMLLHCY